MRDVLSSGRTESQRGRSRGHLKIGIPATGLSLLQRRHAHRRLYHRGHPWRADSHPHRRVGRAAADRPGTRATGAGRRARGCRTRQGCPGTARARAPVRPTSAVVTLPQLCRRRARPCMPAALNAHIQICPRPIDRLDEGFLPTAPPSPCANALACVLL